MIQFLVRVILQRHYAKTLKGINFKCGMQIDFTDYLCSVQEPQLYIAYVFSYCPFYIF